jgi:hypothetical protein
MVVILTLGINCAPLACYRLILIRFNKTHARCAACCRFVGSGKGTDDLAA